MKWQPEPTTVMRNCQIHLFSFLILFLISFAPNAYSQEKPIRISGKILSQKNERLTDCNVVIEAMSNSKLVAFTTTGSENKFNFLLHWNNPDSVLITISHVGYKTKEIKALLNPGSSYHWDVILIPNPKKLEDVTVTSAISRHGDTTSYNVAYFTEPTDIKLIDVINNLPGFTTDDKGIYFKGKKVAKITLNNQDLFSDKINLLTKNLPVDGLKTIQALQNQNMNEKLKGLTGDDEVFVNLVTKKNAIFFGDVEAGAGTLGRYKFNPVLFQLHKKIKAGLIADWNNSGKTMSPGDAFQLKNEEYSNATTGSISGSGIYIPNFNQSRYVKNHLSDVRLSLNGNISKSFKNNAEISFIRDNQSQSSYEISQILSGDSLIQRSAVNQVNILPVYFQVTDKISLDINKNAALSANIIFASDRGKYLGVNDILQNGTNYSTSSNIKNSWNTFSANLDYTDRLTDKKALEIKTDLGVYDLPQNVFSFSPNWPTIFLLPDSSYQQLNQPYSNKLLSLKTTVNYFVRAGKRLFTYNLTGEYKRLNSATTLDFNSITGKPDIAHNALSGKGIYSLKSLSSNFNYNFYIKKLLFSASAEAGVAEIASEEIAENKNYLMPVFKFRISQKCEIFKKAENRLEVSYQQTPMNIYSYRSNIYPTGIVMFEQKKYSGHPVKAITLDHDISLFSIGGSNLAFSQILTLNFTNFISTPTNNGLVFISTDSVMTGRVTKSYYNNLSYSFPIVFLRAKCTLSGGIGLSESFINIGDKIDMSRFNMNHFSVELKRNWNRKVYLTLKSNVSYITNQLHGLSGYNGFKPTLVLLNTFSLKAILANTLESNLSTDFIQNNITSPQSVSTIFTDYELIKTFKKDKISLRLKVENIFDQKQYLVTNRSAAAYQSMYTIPLIRRNLLCTIRFGL